MDNIISLLMEVCRLSWRVSMDSFYMVAFLVVFIAVVACSLIGWVFIIESFLALSMKGRVLGIVLFVLGYILFLLKQ